MRFSSAILLLIILLSPLSAQTDEGARLRALGSREADVLSDYLQFEQGKGLAAAGEHAAAIREFKALAATDQPTLLRPKAILAAGKSYLILKKYSPAVAAFRKLVAVYPEANEAAEGRYLIAKALNQSGNWRAAYSAFEETDLYHPLSYFGKQARLEIKKLKKAHRKKLPRYLPSAVALYRQGLAYFEQADYEMAANIFNRLGREYPKSKYAGEAMLMLGRADEQLPGQYDTAIANLERTAQENSNLAGKAHYYLGLARGRRGDYDRAIAALKKVDAASGLADDAAYWAAYYQEIKGDVSGALASYYALINRFPYSKAVPAAIWRIGRTYYWNSDFKTASSYLHLAQLYPPGEDTPRCLFFEGKALERQGNRAAALEVYKKLIERFDHTYYAYRAQDKISGAGLSALSQGPFNGEDFESVLSSLAEKNQAELSAIMEIWEQNNSAALQAAASEEARLHLEKYKELLAAGLTGYAAEEARFLVTITSDAEKYPLQTKLAQALAQSGEYRTPIRFADRQLKSAVINGKPDTVPLKIWHLSYPKGYWKHVAAQGKKFGVDPYLALAVIREESRFNPRATSRSSARGLMQIMPRTGRGIAKNLDLPRYRTKRLYEPALNIEMGVYYLANLIKRFSNNAYLALAGYNGGPNRIKSYVESWYNGDLRLVDIDEFVESIPKRETRLYVQKVMGSYFEYKRLYDRKG